MLVSELFVQNRSTDHATILRWSSGLRSGQIEDTINQASLTLIHVADVSPEAFAAALGVQQNIATIQALKRLQAADAAAQTLRRLTSQLSAGNEQQIEHELARSFGADMRQRLEVRLCSQTFPAFHEILLNS